MPTDAEAYQRLARALNAHRGDAEAYRRLGAQMTARRHYLDARYGNRRLFVRERLVPLGLAENAAYKLVYDLERGELQGRAGFSPGNMLALAGAYETTPDAIINVLDGGELEPPAARVSTLRPRAVPPVSLDLGPGDLIPEMDPAMRHAAEAHRPAIRDLVRDAVLRGAPLDGASIFPDSPDEAARWDTLVAISQDDPSGPWKPAQLIWLMAIGRVNDDRRRAEDPRRARGVLILKLRSGFRRPQGHRRWRFARQMQAAHGTGGPGLA